MTDVPALLGVDVGFAVKGKTTGLAWRIGCEITTSLSGSSWDSRRGALPKGVRFSVAALDAPVIANDLHVRARACEAVFYRRPFWNRCRPGLSHHGRGLELRRAGGEAVLQFSRILPSGDAAWSSRPGSTAPVVEAFPNAFLGVLIPETDFAVTVSTHRRSKSDWLYERARDTGALNRILRCLGWNEPATLARVAAERNHDKRAALVCLLTAGLANAGQATVVGDAAGGWFWLPPKALWEPWALQGLEEAIDRARLRGFRACVVPP